MIQTKSQLRQKIEINDKKLSSLKTVIVRLVFNGSACWETQHLRKEIVRKSQHVKMCGLEI